MAKSKRGSQVKKSKKAAKKKSTPKKVKKKSAAKSSRNASKKAGGKAAKKTTKKSAKKAVKKAPKKKPAPKSTRNPAPARGMKTVRPSASSAPMAPAANASTPSEEWRPIPEPLPLEPQMDERGDVIDADDESALNEPENLPFDGDDEE